MWLEFDNEFCVGQASVPAHCETLSGCPSCITFGCAWYPSPASTKVARLGFTSTIMRLSWAKVFPASDGHLAPLDGFEWF